MAQINKFMYIIGNLKGAIIYRLKHKKKDRYVNYQHEPIDLLFQDFVSKKDGKITYCKLYEQRKDVLSSVFYYSLGSNTILEVGCGSGLNLYLLRNNLSMDNSLSGFEYTQSRADNAKQNLKGYGIPVWKSDILNNNIPDNSYDIVFSYHVLEQLGQRDANRALKEMYRIARKYVIVSEPSVIGATWYEKLRMYILGYCRKLHCPGLVIEHREDNPRTWPNTSYHYVIKKV